MSYHVGRNHQPLGQFTEAQIRDGLATGTFLTSDVVWRDGMTDWKPLDQVFGFAAAQSLSSPMMASAPLAAPMPSLLPGGHGGVGVMPAPVTAIVSLVLGIAALATFSMCLVGGVLAVPGAICGHMALSRIRRSGGSMDGRGMAIAGLVISYATMAIGLLFLLFIGGIIAIAAASEAK
jgi:hypothetical protein